MSLLSLNKRISFYCYQYINFMQFVLKKISYKIISVKRSYNAKWQK